MALTILVEAAPWAPSTGTAQAVRMAGGGSIGYTHRGFADWQAGVIELPKFTAMIGFDDKGWTGGAIPTAGAVSFMPSDPAVVAQLSSYLWIGAPITIRSGDDSLAAPAWTVELLGTVAALTIRAGVMQFTIADLSGNLAKAVLPDRFAGTGGIEGTADAKDRVKRRSWGRCWNVEGRLFDKANNLWEFGDTSRPLQAFDAVKDIGRATPTMTVVAWQGTAAATLAQLIATPAPAGGAAVAPSIALVKWWTTPNGPLTADLRGEIGAGYVETVAGIAERVIQALSTLTVSNTATMALLRPGAAGLHVDAEGETGGQALDRLLNDAGMTWVLDPDGTVRLTPFTFAAPVETVVAIEVERQASYKPITERTLGYQKNHRIHTDGEISAVFQASDGTYADGTPIEDLKPGQAGATKNTLTYSPSAPTGAVTNGDIWVDTSVTPNVQKVRTGGVWQLGSTVGAVIGDSTGLTNVYRSGGPAVVAVDVITGLGTAADFVGRGALATLNAVGAGQVLPSASGESVLMNGDAEQGTIDGWTIGGFNGGSANSFTATNVNPITGRYSFLLSKAATGDQISARSIKYSCDPSKTYILRWNEIANAAGAAGWYLRVYPFDANGAPLATFDVVGNAAIAATKTPREFLLNFAAGTAGFQLEFINWINAPTAIRFDDVEVFQRQTYRLLDPTAVRLGINITRNDGSTSLTDATAVTILGTAADFIGRGALATLNQATWGTHILGRPANLSALGGAEAINNALVPIAGFNKDPSFQSWSGAAPDNFTPTGMTVTKNVANVIYGGWSLETSNTLAQNVSWLSATSTNALRVPPAALNYVVFEWEVELVSGDFQKAGILYRPVGTGSKDFLIHFNDEHGAAPGAGRYKGLRLVANTTNIGAIASSQFYLMNNYSIFSGAADSAKDIIWHRVLVRQAAVHEIAAFLGLQPNGLLATGTGIFGLDLKESSGILATLNNFKTGLGTAADFAGRGALATRGDVLLGIHVKDSGGNVLVDGAVKNSAIVLNANGTATGGPTGGITFGGLGGGALGLKARLYFGDALLTEDSGGATLATLANFKTVLGMAADFVGRGALATRGDVLLGTHVKDSGGNILADGAVKNSAIVLNANGTASGGPTGGITFGGLGGGALGLKARLYFGDALLTEDSGGATPASLAAFKTALGIAADFVGRGALATKNNVNLDADVVNGSTYARILASQLDGSGAHKLTVAGSGASLGDQRNIPAVTTLNLRSRFSGQSVTYSAAAGSPATATISVSAFTALMGSASIWYNASSVGVSGSGGSTVSYFLYFDDPAYAGGSKTLVATTQADDLFLSNSRVFVGSVDVVFPTSGSGGGSGGGGGGGGCVAVESWVELSAYLMAAGLVVDGDEIECATEDMSTERTELRPVSLMEPRLQPCFRLWTSSATVIASASTPMTLRDLSLVFVDDMLGREVLVKVIQGEDAGALRWEEVTKVEFVGLRWVAQIGVNDGMYFAGESPSALIATHNIGVKEFQ